MPRAFSFPRFAACGGGPCRLLQIAGCRLQAAGCRLDTPMRQGGEFRATSAADAYAILVIVKVGMMQRIWRLTRDSEIGALVGGPFSYALGNPRREHYNFFDFNHHHNDPGWSFAFHLPCCTPGLKISLSLSLSLLFYLSLYIFTVYPWGNICFAVQHSESAFVRLPRGIWLSMFP